MRRGHRQTRFFGCNSHEDDLTHDRPESRSRKVRLALRARRQNHADPERLRPRRLQRGSWDRAALSTRMKASWSRASTAARSNIRSVSSMHSFPPMRCGGGPVAARRRGSLRRPPPARERNARRLSSQPAPWREPPQVRARLHNRCHLPRREMSGWMDARSGWEPG